MVEYKVLPNGCWEFQGYIRPNGYGAYQNGGAHRFMYEVVNGDLGEGYQVDHTCHDPKLCLLSKDCPHRRCVNPDHLQAVTIGENLSKDRRENRNARKTHCPQGHPYDEANTQLIDRGHYIARRCKTCRSDRNRRKRENG